MQPNEALLHNAFYGNYFVRVAGVVITSWLFGSLPFGLIAHWLFDGLDKRLLNTARALAPIQDVLKAVPVLIAAHGGGVGVGLLAAIALVAGDCFCPFTKFRSGDKGGAAELGALLAVSWPVALGYAFVWLVVAPATNYAAVGALAASAAAIVGLALVAGIPGALAGAAMFAFVAAARRDNLARLRAGTEPTMRRPLGARRFSRGATE